jgi:hypothetical protein
MCKLEGEEITYLLVASSRTRTFPGRRIARARQKSCCWPCERKTSLMSVSSPPFSWILVYSPTDFRASIMALSGWEPSGSMLRLMLPLIMSGL